MNVLIARSDENVRLDQTFWEKETKTQKQNSDHNNNEFYNGDQDASMDNPVAKDAVVVLVVFIVFFNGVTDSHYEPDNTGI